MLTNSIAIITQESGLICANIPKLRPTKYILNITNERSSYRIGG
jgi:hypothetical protein